MTTLPMDVLKAHSGLELFEKMQAGDLPPPPIAETLGFRMTEAAYGRAVFVGTPQKAHYNPIDSVHAGWTMTLLDSATAYAVHTTLAPGEGYRGR